MDDAHRLAHRYYEAFNARDFPTCRALLDEHVTVTTGSEVIAGRDAVVAFLHDVLLWFPNLLVKVGRVIAIDAGAAICELQMENLVASATGLDNNPPAAAHIVAGPVCQILDVRDGRITAIRNWAASDPVQQPSRAEASPLVDGQFLTLTRFEEDGLTGVVVAVSGTEIAVGSRYPIDGESVGARIQQSGRPERIDDARGVSGGVGVNGLRPHATVAVPIVVGRQLWGMLEASSAHEPLAPGTEQRLSDVAEIVAGAISTSEARNDLERLTSEQAALLRVAELVARGAGEEELFDVVAVEASRLIDNEGTTLVRFVGPRRFTIVATCGGPAPVGLTVDLPEDDTGTGGELLRTRRPARRDNYQIPSGALFGRADFGAGSSVSVPIIVEDQLWGMLGTLTEGRRLPTGTEERLQKFAELMSAAIANSQARAEVQRLADEQAALRGVAELVARGASEAALFDAVAVGAAGLIGNEATTLVRYEGGRTFTIVATCGGPVAPGIRIVVPDDDRGAFDQVLRNPSRPWRLDDYQSATEPLFTRDQFGVGSSVSVPILVDDRLWGMLGMITEGRPLPPDTEVRLQQFAELVAAALANNQARAEVRQLADEQAALRRVAELVARSAALDQVFTAIAAEASRLLGDLAANLTRFDPDGSPTVVASCNSAVPIGLRLPSDGDTAAGRVFRSGRPTRLSSFDGTNLADLAASLKVGATVAVPITVGGRIWGVLATSTPGRELPTGTEERLEEFAALAAAAIANAENRENLTASRARVLATADETRRRVQRDVHDGAQQRLVQTVITLKVALEAASHGGPTTDLIAEALYHAQRATHDLRELVHGILPASLSRGGLRAGIESLIADLPTPVSLELLGPRPPAETETTVFFIVAEALTNVVKHANATRADVRVQVEAAVLTVEISDDGVGGADPVRGSGLTGLGDRVGAAGGTLTITSLPGAGTTVRAELPAAAG